MARPRTLDRPKLMRAVCRRVSQGELVKYAARAEGVTDKQIREWALADEFSTLYARAREAQAHCLAEQALEIADGSDALTALYEAGVDAEDEALAEAGNKARYPIVQALRANVVNRDRMRMDARKWLTSKIAPKLYGEKLDVTTGGDKLQPTQTIVIGGKSIDF